MVNVIEQEACRDEYIQLFYWYYVAKMVVKRQATAVNSGHIGAVALEFFAIAGIQLVVIAVIFIVDDSCTNAHVAG